MKHFKRAFILFLALSLVFLAGCDLSVLGYLKAPNETQQLFYYSDFDELSYFYASENGVFYSDSVNDLCQLAPNSRKATLLTRYIDFDQDNSLCNYFNYNNELY